MILITSRQMGIRKWDEIMNKQEVYDYLKEKNIWYEITEHKAVYNMEELSQIDIPYQSIQRHIQLKSLPQ